MGPSCTPNRRDSDSDDKATYATMQNKYAMTSCCAGMQQEMHSPTYQAALEAEATSPYDVVDCPLPDFVSFKAPSGRLSPGLLEKLKLLTGEPNPGAEDSDGSPFSDSVPFDPPPGTLEQGTPPNPRDPSPPAMHTVHPPDVNMDECPPPEFMEGYNSAEDLAPDEAPDTVLLHDVANGVGRPHPAQVLPPGSPHHSSYSDPR